MFSSYLGYLTKEILTFSNLLQTSGTFIGLALAYLISYLLHQTRAKRMLVKLTSPHLNLVIDAIAFPFFWCLFQWTVVAACQEFSLEDKISATIAQFATAWLAVRFLTTFKAFSHSTWSLSIVIFLITTLNALGLLHRLVEITENFSLTTGGLHISLLSLFKAGLLFFVLIWSTLKVSHWVEVRLKKVANVEPNIQVLFNKLIRVFLIAFSVLIGLSATGLDLSAFAVFGGAVGVGIGFGLQKVISNLICGIILLVDRSIKPGDVIALDEGKTYGVINKLGARFVSVRTRSGKEHLIPNEEFIINKTENWTFSDSCIRVDIPIQTTFTSDPELILQLLLDSTLSVKRVLKSPSPTAKLRAFGDYGLEFEVRIWIDDPQNGLSELENDILMNVLKKFKEHNIEIPFPATDIRILNLSEKARSSFFDYATPTIPEKI